MTPYEQGYKAGFGGYVSSINYLKHYNGLELIAFKHGVIIGRREKQKSMSQVKASI